MIGNARKGGQIGQILGKTIGVVVFHAIANGTEQEFILTFFLEREITSPKTFFKGTLLENTSE